MSYKIRYVESDLARKALDADNSKVISECFNLKTLKSTPIVHSVSLLCSSRRSYLFKWNYL